MFYELPLEIRRIVYEYITYTFENDRDRVNDDLILVDTEWHSHLAPVLYKLGMKASRVLNYHSKNSTCDKQQIQRICSLYSQFAENVSLDTNTIAWMNLVNLPLNNTKYLEIRYENSKIDLVQILKLNKVLDTLIIRDGLYGELSFAKQLSCCRHIGPGVRKLWISGIKNGLPHEFATFINKMRVYEELRIDVDQLSFQGCSEISKIQCNGIKRFILGVDNVNNEMYFEEALAQFFQENQSIEFLQVMHLITEKSLANLKQDYSKNRHDIHLPPPSLFSIPAISTLRNLKYLHFPEYAKESLIRFDCPERMLALVILAQNCQNLKTITSDIVLDRSVFTWIVNPEHGPLFPNLEKINGVITGFGCDKCGIDNILFDNLRFHFPNCNLTGVRRCLRCFANLIGSFYLPRRPLQV